MDKDASKNLCEAFKRIGVAAARANLIFKKAAKDLNYLSTNRRAGMSAQLPVAIKPKKKVLAKAVKTALVSQI